jgi:hypothetical protein
MGQKMVRFAELCGTRSRQGASKEVHEAGRIRPSSGGNGGHVRWWIGLICALLSSSDNKWLLADREYGLEADLGHRLLQFAFWDDVFGLRAEGTAEDRAGCCITLASSVAGGRNSWG